jgi:hypothetical protein
MRDAVRALLAACGPAKSPRNALMRFHAHPTNHLAISAVSDGSRGNIVSLEAGRVHAASVTAEWFGEGASSTASNPGPVVELVALEWR